MLQPRVSCSASWLAAALDQQLTRCQVLQQVQHLLMLLNDTSHGQEGL